MSVLQNLMIYFAFPSLSQTRESENVSFIHIHRVISDILLIMKKSVF